MKLLQDYFALQDEIYEYFDYKENWCVFPLQNHIQYFWKIDNGDLIFSENRASVESYEEGYEEDDIYVYSIYHQRFLTKAVYVGEDYTMILVDTHTDGNKFLTVLDNKKELNKSE